MLFWTFSLVNEISITFPFILDTVVDDFVKGIFLVVFSDRSS